MSIQDVLYCDKQLIIQRIQSGESLNAIAKSYRCNSGTVWYFMNKNNILINNKKVNRGKADKIKQKIIDLYNAEHSLCKIAKEVGISKCTIRRKLKFWGYDTSRYDDRKDKTRPLLKNRTDEVLRLHYSGYTHREIAKELGYAESCISILLRKLGVQDNYYRKYNIDDMFFRVIDTELKAYILGWWYSDGNVRDSGLLRLQLAEEDKKILEDIAVAMQFDGTLHTIPPPAKFPHRKTQSLLSICNKELANQLISLGCMPAKSMKLVFPNKQQVPLHLTNHFVRGFFDGDGSISRSGITVTSTLSFIQSLSNIMPNNYTNIYQRYKNREPHKSSHQLFIGKRIDRQEFLEWIYNSATISLNRKKTLAFGV